MLNNGLTPCLKDTISVTSQPIFATRTGRHGTVSLSKRHWQVTCSARHLSEPILSAGFYRYLWNGEVSTIKNNGTKHHMFMLRRLNGSCLSSYSSGAVREILELVVGLAPRRTSGRSVLDAASLPIKLTMGPIAADLMLYYTRIYNFIWLRTRRHLVA